MKKRVLMIILALSMILSSLVGCKLGETNGTVDTPESDALQTEPGEDTGENQGGNDDQGGNNDQGGNGDADDPNAFVPVFRFAVTSDIHIYSTTCDSAEKTATLIQQMNKYAAGNADGYGDLDAFVISGDITDYGKVSEFQAAKSVLDSNIAEGTEVVITMGNHDWRHYKDLDELAEFNKIFGEDAAMRDVKIGGYHFITVYSDVIPAHAWEYVGYSDAMAAKLDQMVAAAVADTGPDKPVFVVQHVGNRGTVQGTYERNHNTSTKWVPSTTVFNDIFNKYSNVVTFSGHTHIYSNNEYAIWQGGYTAIQTGAAKAAPVQSFIVEIDADDRMRVRCWDTEEEGFVGDTWLIDSWKKEDFKYTADRFDSDALFFADGAKITVTGNSAGLVCFEFPRVPKESLSARRYIVEITRSDGTVIDKTVIDAEYYRDAFETPYKRTCTGLQDGDYTITVKAESYWYDSDYDGTKALRTEPLTANFTVGGKNALVNFDFTWNAGYVESGTGVITTTANGKYSHSQTVTLLEAGTKVSFTDDNTNANGDTGFASAGAWVISVWKQDADGTWVCDVEASAAAQERISVSNSSGKHTYIYTTGTDNETIRLCYRSGQTSSFTPAEFPKVTIVAPVIIEVDPGLNEDGSTVDLPPIQI
ncbi:MAG: metallophosphoesterase [Clostridia bacterium]|nr:metallophosphoesterase [Clostridia bacterium]